MGEEGRGDEGLGGRQLRRKAPLCARISLCQRLATSGIPFPFLQGELR